MGGPEDREPRTSGSEMRKRPRQERSRATVHSMLEAAIVLLEEHPLTDLSTTMLAGRAGVGIGTLYQYFPDRDTLLREAILAEAERGYGAMHEALLPHVDAGLLLFLREAARTILAPILRRRQYYRHLFGAIRLLHLQEEVAARRVHLRRLWREVLRRRLGGRPEALETWSRLSPRRWPPLPSWPRPRLRRTSSSS